MRHPAHGPFRLLIVAVLCACKSQEPTANPAPSGGSSGVKTAPPPVEAAPVRTPADSWLIVDKIGVELGVIELRRGAPPSLVVERESPDVDALRTRLAEIGGPKGIPLNMHLPSPSGTGRGPYGTSLITYDDPLYRHAITESLERDFGVKEVPLVDDPLPHEGLRRVTVSRSGEKVGSIDFASAPPTLTIDTDKSDGMSLKSTWESIQKLGALKVRYHTLKDAKETLITAQAKPGDANYPEVAVLLMMADRYYLARYAYRLEFAR